MKDLIREAPLGQTIRWITRNKFLRYPEEEAGFECPNCYRDSDRIRVDSDSNTELKVSRSSAKSDVGNIDDSKEPAVLPLADHVNPDEKDIEALHPQRTNATVRSDSVIEGNQVALMRTVTRETTRGYTRERVEVEQEEAAMREQKLPIIAQRNELGDVLVDWYTTDDPANPQNWSSSKKVVAGLVIL